MSFLIVEIKDDMSCDLVLIGWNVQLAFWLTLVFLTEKQRTFSNEHLSPIHNGHHMVKHWKTANLHLEVVFLTLQTNNKKYFTGLNIINKVLVL